ADPGKLASDGYRLPTIAPTTHVQRAGTNTGSPPGQTELARPAMQPAPNCFPLAEKTGSACARPINNPLPTGPHLQQTTARSGKVSFPVSLQDPMHPPKPNKQHGADDGTYPKTDDIEPGLPECMGIQHVQGTSHKSWQTKHDSRLQARLGSQRKDFVLDVHACPNRLGQYLQTLAQTCARALP